MSTGLHPYTVKLREEMDRLHVKVRGQQGDRRGIAEDARLAPARVEEIVAGDKPTEDEHRKLCRALPRLKFYLPILQRWLAEPKPAPPPPVMPPPPPAPLVLYPRTFPEYLRAAREREGLSPEDLADLVEVSRSAIYAWEAGTSTPIATNYARLLDVLPALTAPDVPRPEVRDIAKPAGRSPEQEPDVAPPALAQRSPLIAFGMALGRALPALVSGKGTKALVVALLRDGATAGLSLDEIAAAIEEAP